MEPNNQFTIHNGDNLPLLKQLADNSIDAIVTDPPYGLSFMGKKWDYDVPSEDVWRECLRVLKPGGHLLAFAGTRTQHRMAVRIEDAGFEIRDMIAWVYGSGFPKSLDVSKAIDKAAGAERRVVSEWRTGFSGTLGGKAALGGISGDDIRVITAPATDAARQWDGWGTALKPAMEMITMARKPLSGTVAANVLTHGTGALNVDGCRVEAPMAPEIASVSVNARSRFSGVLNGGRVSQPEPRSTSATNAGRWPANFIHDGSDEVVGLFPVQPSGKNDGKMVSAARFFYCAKASRSEREAGLEEMSAKQKVFNGQSSQSAGMAPGSVEDKFTTQPAKNYHPTVKPIALMRYLCRLVTPPGGIVLDPFMGSGSTGCAAILEGFRFIGMEREPEYVVIAQARIEHAIERAIEQDSASVCNSSQLSLLETLDES